MRRRALLAAFTALVAGVGAFGVRLATADAAPISFSHPGVLVSRAQLDFVKGRVNARLGIAMSNSQQYTESHRPQGTNNLFVAWETLTHANNPA